MEPADSLLCCENGALDAEWVCKAYRDPALRADRRVLANLLDSEARYRPVGSGFKCGGGGGGAGDVRQPMRRMLAYWMVEVCEEHRCQDAVLPLAMNLVDRFLALTPLKKEQLQLVGAVCLLISSKLREARPLTAGELALCADHCFQQRDITDWELLVLHRLRWEVSAVTSHDFLEPLLDRLPLTSLLEPLDPEEVRRRAQTFIIMCSTEDQFTPYPASTVASASLVAAVRGAASCPEPAADCLHRLQHATDVPTDVLRRCVDEIEATVRSYAEEAGRTARRRPTAPPPDEPPLHYDDAGTPTDVRQVHF